MQPKQFCSLNASKFKVGHTILILIKLPLKGPIFNAFITYVNASFLQELFRVMGINATDFIRTTEPRHMKAAQHFWVSSLHSSLYGYKIEAGYICIFVCAVYFSQSKRMTSVKCLE